MKEQIKKVTTHIKNNKSAYIAGSVGVLVGVAGGLVYAGRMNSGIQVAQKINQIGFRNETNAVIINLVERSNPSKPVHLVGTDRYFSSMNEAARVTGHSLTQISKNVHGEIPDIKGDVFELLTLID